MSINLEILTELYTIFLYSQILIEDYGIYDPYYFGTYILVFYRNLQKACVQLVLVMFLRILLQMRIFKALGLYIIIT